MSEPEKNKELSPEIRILIASILSMAVIFVWAKFFAPKAPVNPPAAATQTAPALPATSSLSPSLPLPSLNATATAPNANTPQAAASKSDTQERSIVVENDLYRVEFSNRGAVVKSWQLKKYMDDGKPPRVLDVVHPEAANDTGGWPFSLAIADGNLERAANTALYSVPPAAGPLRAPAELKFEYSDGHIVVTKTFHFDHTYTVTAETSVAFDGNPVPHALAWRGGFGDLTVHDPIPVETVNVFYSAAGKVQLLAHKKLDLLVPGGVGSATTGDDYAGIADRYFAAAFLPANGAPPASITARYWKLQRTIQFQGNPALEPVSEMAAGSTALPQPGQVAAGPGSFPALALRVYVGPKDYDELKKMTPPLNALVNFGWFEIIADPLFHSLRWLHKYIHNWGWAIVALTLIINMLFFPLRISGYRSQLKMQRVAPEIKQIQDKYKKYKMNDPKKAEMNKEVMAVYSREGINPVSSCIPQLIQLPIWYGFYRAVNGTIELRHAPWFWWIRDLSAKDPYYILPLLMGLSMYLSTKMTPMATADPQQQMMMKVMPIGMAAIFMISPWPSGLAVYILTQGVVGVGQQWYLNKTHPAPVPVKAFRGKKS